MERLKEFSLPYCLQDLRHIPVSLESVINFFRTDSAENLNGEFLFFFHIKGYNTFLLSSYCVEVIEQLDDISSAFARNGIHCDGYIAMLKVPLKEEKK